MSMNPEVSSTLCMASPSLPRDLQATRISLHFLLSCISHIGRRAWPGRMTRGKCPLVAEPVAKFHGGKQDEKLDGDLEPAFNSVILVQRIHH